MSVDFRARMARASDLEPPDLWDEAATRARRGIHSIPDLRPPASPQHRLAAGALAFALFILAAALAWSALRPPRPGVIAGGDGTHRTTNVYEPSTAMLPTIEVGETVVVDLDAYAADPPAHGDVVAFTATDQPDLIRLARVIGLPGDVVEEVTGTVYVNGVPLDEPFGRADPRTVGPWTVEAGHVFLMGDNRAVANDSRFALGQVPIGDLVGRVILGATPSEAAPAPAAGTASLPTDQSDTSAG
jgi:signal peptidase I